MSDEEVEVWEIFCWTQWLVTTLLVYGALPFLGIPSDEETHSKFQREVALNKEN